MINDIIKQITNCPYQQIENIIKISNKAERQTIVAAFEEIINNSLTKISSVDKPFLINISGIPCSGKTTYCHDLKNGKVSFDNVDFSNVLYLAFDGIMVNSKLPYKIDKNKGLTYAFNQWEIPARIAGYELLKRAIDYKFNVLFEHSSSIIQHIELFNMLLSDKYNYDVHFIHLNIDKTIAKKRAKQDNKIFLLDYIEERYAALTQLLPQYKKICTTFKQIEHKV